MTNRFARMHHKLNAMLGGRAKLALALVALWIGLEIAAAAAVAIAGKEWLVERKAQPDSHAMSIQISAKRHSFDASLTVF
jgi:hypothetical protein